MPADYDPVAHFGGTVPQYHRTTTPRHISAIAQLLEHVPVQSVYEIGIGSGRVAWFMIGLYLSIEKYHGIDLSTPALEMAKDRLGRFDTRKVDLSLELGDFRSHVPDERVDVALAVEALMHCPPEDLDSAARILARTATKAIVHIDWWVPSKIPMKGAAHNFMHNYAAFWQRIVPKAKVSCLPLAELRQVAIAVVMP